MRIDAPMLNARLRHGENEAGGDVGFTVCFVFARGHFLLANYASIATNALAMNNKHRQTLDVVFTDPVSGTIAWADIESLLVAAGARIVEGRGSRMRFVCNGEIETFHRPHPAKEAKRYQVRAARAYLERIGVRP